MYKGSYATENMNKLHQILDDLISYYYYQFKAEQKYMRVIGYKDIEKQIIEHEYFTDKVLRLKHDSVMNASELTKDTIVFLGRCLLHHVTVEDKKIVI